MFRNKYNKVSSINQNKVYYDSTCNKLGNHSDNTLDKIKLATENDCNNTINKSNTNMVCENVVINDILLPIENCRKKSQDNSIQNIKQPFFCEICNYTTNIKCNYNKHLLSLLHKKISKIKIDNAFCCKMCDYYTNRKNDYDKHMNTKKHISKLNDYKNPKNINQIFTDKDNNKIDITLLKDDITSIIIKEIKNMNEQNKLLVDVTNKSNNTINNTNNNITNSNQQFNLNFFLNETCKDAMNLSDFIENMQVTMEDMEKTGELGFAKGMSRIIMNNLNAIDVCKRPIHCSDVKRETLYVKNNGVWE